MPREKKTRNPLGSIFTRKLTIDGKKVTRYDARKRYTNPQGEPDEKFQRCRTYAEATTALTNFQNEITNEFEKAKVEQEKQKEYSFFELCDYFSKEHIKKPVYSGKLKIGGYFAENTKTGVEGIIPITERLYNEIVGIRNGKANFFDSQFVFPFKNVYNAWNRACKQAKIENLQFRDLRSTGATRMMLAGNDGTLVRKVTRHTQEKMLREHYTNIDIENARLIGERLSEFNEFSLAKANAKVNDVLEQSATAS
ncbi:MAG TPA: tyrosine-type recombinase/integrase [Pyrinomonadaceae bacterium]|jgi:hypothetical protein